MRYLPLTPEDRTVMLSRIGVHHKTGEPMPQDMQRAIQEGHSHMAGRPVSACRRTSGISGGFGASTARVSR
jgi:hypothetical protein